MLSNALAKVIERPWWVAIFGAVLVSAFPQLDLWASGLFFDGDSATWTPRSNLMQFARSGVPPIIIGMLLFVLVLWGAGRVLGQSFWSVTGRKAAYLVATLLIGPGLIVESFLKVFHGRARPRDVVPFGGEDPFTPALWLSDACARNCSFVSGHAALAFWVTAFAFLLPVGHRSPLIAAGVGVGLLMGVARMAEGAHFLSDIIFAGIIVVAVNVAMARVILDSPANMEVRDGA
jgi:lipid A 4'-phosphatase